MSMKTALWASAAGLALALSFTPSAQAETLRVMSGAASSTLNVSMNRAVVVESDTPFAEISVANPAIADFSTLSDRTIYVLGKAPGRTTLTLLSPDGKLITNVEVQVTPDIAEFKERLRQILPGENIEVRTANDGIVLSGTVSSSAKLDRALDLASRYSPDRVSNLMNVGGTQQVQLKVRFAEMSRSVSKTLNGSVAFTSSYGGAETGTYLSGSNAIGNPIEVSPGTEGAFGIGFGGGSFRAEILLEALESKGLVRTLAEPNLTALSGQEARFLAGGEYPIPVVGGDGDISIDYKPFGIALSFVPTVVDGDLINLVLSTQVSGIDPTLTVTNGGFAVSAFRTRTAETTVELRDGESFAIAGLMQDDFRDLNGQVPWLGDVPVLGALFRSADFTRAQSELVVIVTPHLVTPTRGEALALPTDRIKIPTEAELFLFGDTSGGRQKPKTGAAAEVAKQDFGGSYGYVME